MLAILVLNKHLFMQTPQLLDASELAQTGSVTPAAAFPYSTALKKGKLGGRTLDPSKQVLF